LTTHCLEAIERFGLFEQYGGAIDESQHSMLGSPPAPEG
jgi:hypothetical protein